MNTAQLVRQWQDITKLLRQIKPDQPIGVDLGVQLAHSCSAASSAPALPHITWQVLLQKKVRASTLLDLQAGCICLSACSDAHAYGCMGHAQHKRTRCEQTCLPCRQMNSFTTCSGGFWVAGFSQTAAACGPACCSQLLMP